jgi:hypothetical protein
MPPLDQSLPSSANDAHISQAPKARRAAPSASVAHSLQYCRAGHVYRGVEDKLSSLLQNYWSSSFQRCQNITAIQI